MLLVEVLSPSSAHFDLHAKFDQYKSIPSLREYVLFSQDRYRAIVRFKLADQIWQETVFESPDELLPLRSIGVELPLAAFYDGVKIL